MVATSPEVLTFWLIAAAMAVLALAFVVWPLTGGRSRRPSGMPVAAVNIAVYRSQLAELDRDRDSGQLSESEFARSRAELEQRLLADLETVPRDAAGTPGSECRPELPGAERAPKVEGVRRPPGTIGTAIVLGLLLPTTAFGLYLVFGEPAAIQQTALNATQLQDLAREEPEQLRARLVAHLEREPRDGRSWILLARLDAAAERYADAEREFAAALAASSKVARDPAVWCEYADAVAMNQGGKLAGKPTELVAHALTLDAQHPQALEMAGSAAFERNDIAAALGHWRQLLAQLPERSVEHRELSTAIARAEELAGIGRTQGSQRPQ